MSRQFLSHQTVTLTVLMTCSLFMPVVYASNSTGDYFNPALLEKTAGSPEITDLSVYERNPDQQMPGTYHVDIAVNNNVVTTQARDVIFTLDKKSGILTPCITPEELKRWGVRTRSWPVATDTQNCVQIQSIPGAFYDFRFNQQLLNISIPQIALSPVVQGDIPPEEWDEGINAFLVNYSLNGARSERQSENHTVQNYHYMNLRPGINFGPWRFRHYTTWQHNHSGSGKWDNVYSYLQRNIVSLKSQMVIGDSSTASDVFDSVPFRGGQLSSDDDMLPVSTRSYAPVVRGIARSEATIIIRQNGYVIYQSTVAPGAFEITDISPTGTGGDLDVTVQESDGSEQHMTVPYSTLPSFVREGHFRYSLTAGNYRSYYSGASKTPFIQGTGTWGVPWDITLYGGLQNAGSRYQSWSLGAGKNLGGWGAFSAGVTHTFSSSHGRRSEGQSLRVLYNKNILLTGSQITLAGYRYSTQGYRTLNEVLENRNAHGLPLFYYNEKRRNRAEVMINQPVADSGMLHATLVNEDYWDRNSRSQSMMMGYNRYIGGASIGISYSYNKNPYFRQGVKADRLFSLTLNIPLSSFDNNTWFTYSTTHQQGKGTTHNAGMSGTLLEDNTLGWGGYIGQSYKHNPSIAGNINWKTPRGTFTGGYSQDKDSRNYMYGISGGSVVHAKGLTLSGPLGETIGLVEAPGAANVRLSNFPGDATNHAGYAVVSWLSPYRMNEITLDNESLPEDTDVTLMTRKVVPTRGAVVRARYQVRTGHRMLMKLLRADKSPVPFGALVTLNSEDTSQAAIVGDKGMVYLSGLPKEGQLQARWNEGVTGQCHAGFTVGEKDPISGLYHGTVFCRSSE